MLANGVVHQVEVPVVLPDPKDPNGGKRKTTLAGCSLLSTYTP